MMCILDLTEGEVTGWIIGADTHDLRRQVDAIRWNDPTGRLNALAAHLYLTEFAAPGKHILPTGHFLLVT
jgi:hypothetical protein